MDDEGAFKLPINFGDNVWISTQGSFVQCLGVHYILVLLFHPGQHAQASSSAKLAPLLSIFIPLLVCSLVVHSGLGQSVQVSSSVDQVLLVSQSGHQPVGW